MPQLLQQPSTRNANRQVSVEALSLPENYARQKPSQQPSVDDFWTPQRIQDAARYQWHVYTWAAALIRRHKLRSVLDIGCGVGSKITSLILPVCADVEGIDSAAAIQSAAQSGLNIPLHAVDLENPSLTPTRNFDLILCVDVLEHLTAPDRTIEFIRTFAKPSSLILLSTPDRDRLRGRDCRRCEKPDHIQEWAASEFRQFLRSNQLRTLRWKLLSQDRSSRWKGFAADALFRARIRARSPLCCNAVLCQPVS